MKEWDEYRIELYRGTDLQFFGTIPFLPIVKESLEFLLDRSLLLESFRIYIHPVPEQPVAMGTPVVENLVPNFGYTYVEVYQGNLPVYQHPHRLYNIVTRILQKKLSNQYPEEKYWGFRVDVPGIPQISAAELNFRKSVLHSKSGIHQNLEIPADKSRKKNQFKIRRLEEEEPPIKRLADFGIAPAQASQGLTQLHTQANPENASQGIDENINAANAIEKEDDKAPVKIVLKQSLYQDLCHQRPLSRKVEEGGFLTGKVYRDGDDADVYLLEVNNALTAKYTGASFLHLTFTGDSFVEVKRTLNQNYSDERLLGWYHTHLFPATPSFGLSSIDVELHFSTFTIPWQLAGLINLNGSDRTLRFYARQGNKMVLCPYWLRNERH